MNHTGNITALRAVPADGVCAELTGSVTRDTGEVMRMSMAEVFVMRSGKIAERRAWVIELKENNYR